MLQPQPTAGDTHWFTHDRFGMFIHWGLYASGARQEWLQNHEEISAQEYSRYFERFDPDLFEPQKWAKAAQVAGMKYVVVTAKHHEGFCLWDTQYSDYKATNTLARRDLLREIVDAFREEGLRIGLYYSLIDWRHPDFTIDHNHPQRNHPDAEQLNRGRDMTRYAAYMRNQIEELLTEYGPIDIVWFDYSYPNGDRKYPHLQGKGRDDWESEKLLTKVRELAPRVIVNNRLDLPRVAPDMHTPEQYQPTRWFHVDGQPVVWEACQTLSGSWGYHRDETSWKSAGQLIRMLIDTVSKGGNLLMNVGPTARGVFDERAASALEIYADWMTLHARSIYGCSQSEYSAPSDVRYTQNFETDRLYVHIFAYPFKHLHLPGLAGKVKYAQFLHDASEIPLDFPEWLQKVFAEENDPDCLTLALPVLSPDVEVPVIELFLEK